MDNDRTIEDVVTQYQAQVENRLKPYFDYVDVAWPPEKVALVSFKDTRLMEFWAFAAGKWQHIKDYRIKGMSGTRGPKLREGDQQVPEGVYRVELLNPNSAYHLSLKIDYPNAYDRQQAEVDGRVDLGGDIFIHGGRASKGCLAIGNRAAEDLFVLAALIGESNVSVLITPRDFRFRPQVARSVDAPLWISELNQKLAGQLQQFPLAEKRH
ncbi:MAG: L,D-transpeptidase family protein [Sedimenticola sp.]|nr:L,D-transpeptidase family protein [Sedimenticola sp.]